MPLQLRWPSPGTCKHTTQTIPKRPSMWTRLHLLRMKKQRAGNQPEEFLMHRKQLWVRVPQVCWMASNAWVSRVHTPHNLRAMRHATWLRDTSWRQKLPFQHQGHRNMSLRPDRLVFPFRPRLPPLPLSLPFPPLPFWHRQPRSRLHLVHLPTDMVETSMGAAATEPSCGRWKRIEASLTPRRGTPRRWTTTPNPGWPVGCQIFAQFLPWAVSLSQRPANWLQRKPPVAR